MKFPIAFITLAVAAFVSTDLSAQTEVRVSSFGFSTGVYPTFSVNFSNTDAKSVEKYFKDALDRISANVSNKKEVMSIGTRLPEVSSDTIRVFVKADQPKKTMDVVLQVAFRAGGSFIGPDNDKRQVEGCKTWILQQAVMLKKEIAQHEVEDAQKLQQRSENELADLVKEKDRAQNSIEKTQQKSTEAGQEKVQVESDIVTMTTRVDAKKAEVSTTPTESNTKELQSLLKDQEKLKSKSSKLTDQIESAKKKVEDLQYKIKQNIADQEAKGREVDARKKIVEELRMKLANIN